MTILLVIPFLVCNIPLPAFLVWITYKQLYKDVEKGKKKLRGFEPLEWFEYVTKGGPIHPMGMFAKESDKVKFPAPPPKPFATKK